MKAIRNLLLLLATIALALVAARGDAADTPPAATAPDAPKAANPTAPPAATPAPTPAPAASTAPARKVTKVTLMIRHRVFHDFQDVVAAELGDEFKVGDTDYVVKLTDYVPDFAMDLSTHKVVSRSNQPNNPAFRLVVSEKGAPQDTTWAMLDYPPHFARNSMLAFHVVRIDFDKGKPMYPKTDPTTGKENKK